MPKSTEFAERQYETTFHLELGTGGVGPFVPTQPLEWHLGIDAATDARDVHRIWRILNATMPRRVTLSPTLWPRLPRRFHSAISGRMVSLFFQFKVPKYQDGKRARYRLIFGAPYYEVGVTKHQQSRLADLQRRVQSRALVRYASPAFWTRTDFDRFATQRQVLSQSAYMVPSRVGEHRKWMYAGPSGKVVLNPDPEESDGESWEAVTALLGKVAREETLSGHVRGVAESLGKAKGERVRADETEWLRAVRRYVRLSQKDERYLSDVRTIVDAAKQANTLWVLMVSPDGDTRRVLEMLRDEWERAWRHFLY